MDPSGAGPGNAARHCSAGYQHSQDPSCLAARGLFYLAQSIAGRTLAPQEGVPKKKISIFVRSTTQQLPGQQRTYAGKQRALLGWRQAFGARQVRAADMHLRTNCRTHQGSCARSQYL